MLDTPISVTVEMACKVTGVTRNQLEAAIRSGEIETAYVGKRRVVVWKSLEQFIEKHKAKGAAA